MFLGVIGAVSVPYEITLLSNVLVFLTSSVKVSVPYEITLLSNYSEGEAIESGVSVPYEITLLSNEYMKLWKNSLFQYLMKLHYSQTKVVADVYARRFQYLMKLHYSQTQLKPD